MTSKARDLAVVAAAYAVAIGVAAWVVVYVSELTLGWWMPPVLPGDVAPLFWGAVLADVAATGVIFAASRAFDNSSFYDAYWSVAPPVLLGYWLWTAPDVNLRGVLLSLLVLWWAVRLTHNWARGWSGLNHQDWRYVDLKGNTGAWYPLVDLFGIQLFPTVLVLAGSVPLFIVAQTPDVPWHPLDAVWVVVGVGAVWLEARADNVLRRFRSDPSNRGQVLQADVWAWCRHPNYVGELGFWLALAIAGAAAGGGVWAWVGFVAMLGLFTGVSIPMIDRRQLAAKPDYAAYREAVPALLPGLRLKPRT